MKNKLNFWIALGLILLISLSYNIINKEKVQYPPTKVTVVDKFDGPPQRRGRVDQYITYEWTDSQGQRWVYSSTTGPVEFHNTNIGGTIELTVPKASFWLGRDVGPRYKLYNQVYPGIVSDGVSARAGIVLMVICWSLLLVLIL